MSPISTGAPQGCVLSPFLYTMYTNSCRSAYLNNRYFKYADDTALVGLLSDDETDYRSDIDHFVSWCVANCLELNVVKTKELVIDFRSGVRHPTPVNINGQHIEIVHSYKYMGTTIGDKLRWDDNAMNLYKKGQQRLYFLRKLNTLHIDRNIVFVFHDSFVKCYDVRSCLLVGKSLSKNKEKLNRINIISCKIAMCCTPDVSLAQLYKSRTLQMGTKILSDPTHFLHYHYGLLHSGRRYRMPTVKTQRALKSFIPSSIKYLNQPQ